MYRFPKGLSIVVEFGQWYVGLDFKGNHWFVALGWISVHLFTFAYLEHMEFMAKLMFKLVDQLQDELG